MNKYQDAIDVMARYIIDCKLGLKRCCDREIDTAMAKIVELEKHCNALEKALDAACEYLARYGNGDSFVKMNKNQWKEWLMGDE